MWPKIQDLKKDSECISVGRKLSTERTRDVNALRPDQAWFVWGTAKQHEWWEERARVIKSWIDWEVIAGFEGLHHIPLIRLFGNHSRGCGETDWWKATENREKLRKNPSKQKWGPRAEWPNVLTLFGKQGRHGLHLSAECRQLEKKQIKGES